MEYKSKYIIFPPVDSVTMICLHFALYNVVIHFLVVSFTAVLAFGLIDQKFNLIGFVVLCVPLFFTLLSCALTGYTFYIQDKISRRLEWDICDTDLAKEIQWHFQSVFDRFPWICTNDDLMSYPEYTLEDGDPKSVYEEDIFAAKVFLPVLHFAMICYIGSTYFPYIYNESS